MRSESSQLFYQPIRQFKRVILPAIMRIYLKHVGHPQIFERGMQRRDMCAILGRHYRLSKGGLEHPALLYPSRLKSWHDPFKVGEILTERLLLTHSEERIVHRTIVAEVDKVSSFILGRETEVGVLEQTRERKPRVTDIDPVAVGKLAVQGEDQAMGTICLAPVVPGAVFTGQCGNEAAGKARWQGRDHAVNHPGSLACLHLPVTICQRFRLLHAGAKQHLPARLADALNQGFVDLLKAPAQVTQLRCTIVEARPKPRQGDLVVQRAKLAHEELLKHHLVWTCTHPTAQPGRRRFAFQPLRVGYFKEGTHCCYTQAFIDAPRGKAEQRQWRVQLVNLPTDEGDGARPHPFEAISQAEFFYDFDGGGIATKELVVKLLQPGIADTKTGRQPARCRLLLKDHYCLAFFCQAIRHHQS